MPAVISIRAITPNDDLYPQECALRERVLLGPVGYDFERFVKDYPFEERFEHFVAVTDHPASGLTVLACALLLPGYPDAETGKVMQVAVNLQRQGEGIGRRLMTTLEARAFGELGLRSLFCHAQMTAVPFYEKLGWQPEGEIFQEAGIDHRKMVLRGADLAAEGRAEKVSDTAHPHGV